MTRIIIQQEDFDLHQEYQHLRQLGGGAIVVFTGLVRDFDQAGQGLPIDSLFLQHYPGMTERLLGEVVDEARSRWKLLDITVIHRVGNLQPGDQIVLVGVCAHHRGDAFSAAEFVMDYLKTRATLWKKTISAGQEQWLDMKSSDRAAAERWRKPDDER